VGLLSGRENSRVWQTPLVWFQATETIINRSIHASSPRRSFGAYDGERNAVVSNADQWARKRAVQFELRSAAIKKFNVTLDNFLPVPETDNFAMHDCDFRLSVLFAAT
jgi:hypothetical protein